MSDKPLISILTINFNTADFIGLMLKTFEKLTKNSYEVLICDNGSSKKDILKLVKFSQQYSNVTNFFRIQSSPGSIGHGEALDFLIQKVKTPYFVTMDADAAVFFPHWDEVLLSRINQKCKLIGTPIASHEGVKAYDFPNAYCVFYETEAFKKLNHNPVLRGYFHYTRRCFEIHLFS